MLELADMMQAKVLRELVTTGKKRVRFSNSFFTMVGYTPTEREGARHIRTDLYAKRPYGVNKNKEEEGVNVKGAK